MRQLFRKRGYFFFLLALLPLTASAQNPDPSQVLAILRGTFDALQILVTIAFTAAVVVFGYGIFKLIAAAGDPGTVQKAKGILLWGVVGMAVLASIFGLIQFMQRYFGVGGASGTIVPPNITLPGGGTFGGTPGGGATGGNHNACQSNRCVIVSGAGTDECSLVGEICAPPPPPPPPPPGP